MIDPRDGTRLAEVTQPEEPQLEVPRIEVAPCPWCPSGSVDDDCDHVRLARSWPDPPTSSPDQPKRRNRTP